MSAAFVLGVEFVSTGACPTCGIPVIVTSNFERHRRLDKQTFYCPSGHPQSFRTSEIDELKAQLERKAGELKSVTEQLNQACRSRDAYKGRVTAIKNRVQNGVCPCCNRTFQNLMGHMKTKHPDWEKTL